jgi:hypothetical protein
MTALAALLAAPSAALAVPYTFDGTLSASQTWNRTLFVPPIDSSNDNTPYQIHLFQFSGADPDVNFEVITGASSLDTTMYLFVDAWDVSDPLGAANSANALYWDDDSIGFLSAIGSGYGGPAIPVVPNQTYGLIVSGFTLNDIGDYQVRVRPSLAGVDVQPEDVDASTAAVPEPATAGLLGLAAMGLLARRRRGVAWRR